MGRFCGVWRFVCVFGQKKQLPTGVCQGFELAIQFNKIEPQKVVTSNMDGREFLRAMAKAPIQGPIEIFMNLTQLALDLSLIHI